MFILNQISRRIGGWCRLAATLVVSSAAAAPFEWVVTTPEAKGLSSAKLDAFKDHLAAHKTKALLIACDDHIVYEWYSADHSATKPHYTASMAKALIGGVAVAVAISDGRLSLDEPAAKFVPQWKDDPRKSRITLRQLGSHTSGLDDAKDGEIPHDQLPGWMGEFWKRLPPPRDPFTLARDVVPLRFDPGIDSLYSNPGIAMLGYVTTAALKDAPQKNLQVLLRDRVMRPIGIKDAEWSCGYGKPVEIDGLALVAPWGGGAFTARAAARVVRLMLREGNWDGEQLIKASAVRATTEDAGTPGACGIGWWSAKESTNATVPRDAFYARGAQDQIAMGIPSRKIIVIRNGGALGEAQATAFFTPLMNALK
jgi:CubicO group peptidase (beta-lactamase class C family)